MQTTFLSLGGVIEPNQSYQLEVGQAQHDFSHTG